MADLLEQTYEVLPLGAVSVHPDNAKRGDVAAIAESIDASGFYGAIVVQKSTGHILIGNHRWLAAQAEGLTELPVITVDVDDDRARRMMVGDNRLSELGDFDTAKLTALLESFGGDLAGTGYSVDDLHDLLGGSPAGNGDPDAVPDTAPALTVPGDVWLLGPHRVLCGDATSPTDLGRLMGDQQAHMVWTDPPYNVAYEGGAGTIENDDLGAAEFGDLLAGAMGNAAAALRKGGAIYVAHAETERFAFTKAFLEAGLKLSGCLVWRKNALVLGRSDYQWQHEPILYGWKPGASHRWFGGRKQTTVLEADGSPFRLQEDGSWQIVLGDRVLVVTGADVEVSELAGSVMEFDRPSRSSEHPTMKPTALIERMLVNSSRAGDIVLDLFGGSGSTLIAAHALGRVAHLMELDPRFVDVICRRFEEHTGVVPVAESTGRPHTFLEG